jgi:hypothetical protein
LNELQRLFAPDEAKDAMRKLGGLLLGLGLFMTFIRKGSSELGSTWGDWGLLVTLLIAFAFLYGVGMLGALSTGRLRSWEAVYLVFGILVAPWVLLQFVEAVGGSPGASLNIFWIFAATAGLAVAAALVAGLRYGLLLASLAVIVSWSALWDKILSSGIGEHFGTYRGLLIILAGLLLAAAYAVRRLDGREGEVRSSEVVTGAAASAVLAGSLSFPRVFALENPFVSVSGPQSSLLWEIVLLAAALLAVAYGSRFAARGPAYVGGIGLGVFLLLAGMDANDATPEGDIAGWPLILVIVGVAVFAISLLPAIGAPNVGLEVRLRRSGPKDGDGAGRSDAGGGDARGGEPPSAGGEPPRAGGEPPR